MIIIIIDVRPKVNIFLNVNKLNYSLDKLSSIKMYEDSYASYLNILLGVI